MTPTVSSRRRGASLAMGGIFVVAGTLLAHSPSALAEPSSDAVSAIDEKATSFTAQYPWLGPATGAAEEVKGGAMRDYQGGAIFYSTETGAHVMYGEILNRYKALGGPTSDLGFPKNDESETGDGAGRFNDFSAPEGASIYWNPQQGASVIKGKVLEAWRQSGGITGPFGYPSADMSVVDGVQTGKFAGPEGTEIQWSKAAGLVTIPAALAAKIPGFADEETTSMSKPSATSASAPSVEKKGGFKWWWLIPILALLGLLAFLPRLFRKPASVEPVKVAAQPVPEVKKVVAPPPPPAPQPVTPPASPRPVTPPAAPVPPAPKPVVQAPTPPPPPPAPKPLVQTPPPAPPAPKPVEEVKTEVHHAVHHEAAPAVIRYQTHTPDTGIKITYENNALGEHQESSADKSDLTPDHLQE